MDARRAWTKYFVTGATGFIGGRVVRQLIEAGHKVIAVVRNPSRAQDLRALGVDVRPGDVPVRAEREGYEPGESSVSVTAGSERSLELKMRKVQPTTGALVLVLRNDAHALWLNATRVELPLVAFSAIALACPGDRRHCRSLSTR